jgi:hypothetical protein
MSSGLRSQASNEGQGVGQGPLGLQADFSQGIATAVQEQVSRAVSDVSTKLSAGLDKRIEQLDQRAEKRDAERRADAVCAAREAAEEQAKRFTEILASIATQNTGGAQLGVLSSANPVVPLGLLFIEQLFGLRSGWVLAGCWLAWAAGVVGGSG